MPITPYQTFHQRSLGPTLFPFLSANDAGNLAQVSQTWSAAKDAFDVQLYQRVLMSYPKFITDATGVYREVETIRTLGFGGTKVAVELQGGHALLLPSTRADQIERIIPAWNRIVYEEVAMSQLLTRIGLLSPLSWQVRIACSPVAREGSISAYLSETFENLGRTREWYVIDRKNEDSSIWKLGQHFLFRSEEERLNIQNWDSVVDALITDAVKLCIHQIPFGGDSFNLAIVRNPYATTISQYEARFFGFDFSSKRAPLYPRSFNSKSASTIFDSLLDYVCFREFGRRYDANNEEGARLKAFKNQLLSRYSRAIATRMSDLAQSPCSIPDRLMSAAPAISNALTEATTVPQPAAKEKNRDNIKPITDMNTSTTENTSPPTGVLASITFSKQGKRKKTIDNNTESKRLKLDTAALQCNVVSNPQTTSTASPSSTDSTSLTLLKQSP